MEAVIHSIQFIGQLFWFFLPVATANMAPVVFKNQLTRLATPIDGGRLFRGQPLFGDHKTWRGLLVATLTGGVVFLLQWLLTQQFPEQLTNWAPFDITQGPWWFGFLFGFAAIFGDLVKSFFKRRINIKPGQTWFPFDQIDLIVFSLVVASWFYPITITMIIVSFLIGPLVHIVINRVGFWLKLKETPW
jgi:CDP-2,3-bis-(O-geranylgeranyl)-sn-glycerol synthase